MQGYLAIILHAHLPFVRHPEYQKCLEEIWLFEAITECYVPLLQLFNGWARDGLAVRLTLSLSPTLCAMLRDELLQARYERYLNDLIELAENEIRRNLWQPQFRQLARYYHKRFEAVRAAYLECGGDIVGEFAKFQQLGLVEIIPTAATHAVLPLLANHPPSMRAQVAVARDFHLECFGREPHGFWLPECAYAPEVEPVLQEMNVRWVVVDTHAVLTARPAPRFGAYAPVYTPNGLAAFARDFESARQVWSRTEGYPGDPRYRDFYRDIGFDLDYECVRKYLPTPICRGATGMKYFAITSPTPEKQPYAPEAALSAARQHARHFWEARKAQINRIARLLDIAPLIVAPFDAELFGHWWYEGPEFLDAFVRRAVQAQSTFALTTPTDYLKAIPTHQIAVPGATSWGEGGYLAAWLSEKNAWIYPCLLTPQKHMVELVRLLPTPNPLQLRALQQASRELLLAQASDWPFMLNTGTNQVYARKRIVTHLTRHRILSDQLFTDSVDEEQLRAFESTANIFPKINFRVFSEGA